MDLNTHSRSDFVYDINVFHELTRDGFNYTLDDNVIQIINRIATKVGAPSYVKTPIFQKKHNKNKKKKHVSKPRELTDEEWETFRSFEKTTYHKDMEGINRVISDIYGLLNKLTDSNYIDIRDEIKENINQVIEDVSHDDMTKVSKHIFMVASSNKFYSNLYAKLYKELSEVYTSLKTTFKETYDEMRTILDNLECCDETNYEKFCEINKNNEKRKALVSFIVNCMNEELVDMNNVYLLLDHFVVMFNEKMKEENNVTICEELSEIIYIMVVEGFKNLVTHDEFNSLWETLTELSETSTRSQPSLTNKSVFKLMDLIEEFEDEF